MSIKYTIRDDLLDKYPLWFLYYKFYASRIYGLLVFSKSIVISNYRKITWPIKSRLIVLFLKYHWRHWSIDNKRYLIKRWCGIYMARSRRLRKERYKKNMETVATMSQKTGVKQHVILETYDINKCTLTYKETNEHHCGSL